MSIVKKCDKCGQIIDIFKYAEIGNTNGEKPWRYEITKDCWPYSDRIKIDLCLGCKRELAEWLKKRGN